MHATKKRVRLIQKFSRIIKNKRLLKPQGNSCGFRAVLVRLIYIGVIALGSDLKKDKLKNLFCKVNVVGVMTLIIRLKVFYYKPPIIPYQMYATMRLAIHHPYTI